MKVRLGLIAAFALASAACASTPALSVPAPAVPVPPVAQSIAPAAGPPDQCGASELQDLVGKPRTEIPVPVDPSRRRVYCSTCMVTQDYDPSRLDIVVDSQSGLIVQVKCG